MTSLRVRLAAAAHRVLGLTLGVGLSVGLLAAGPAWADPALWVVKDADSTIYLFGTVHALRDTTTWRTPKIEAALKGSDEVWVEIKEVGDPAASQAAVTPLIAQLGVDAARPLSSKLDAADRKRLQDAADKLKLPMAQLEPLRPWLAAVQLSILPLIQAGYNPDAGVDSLVAKAAQAENKPLNAFETTEQQLRFFAELPPEVELALLHEALDDLDGGPAKLDELSAAWVAGDMPKFEALFLEDMRQDSPELYKVLIVDRNEAWARTLEARLKGSGVSFVAVGAGHLVGPDSVQARLKARGVKSERR